MRFIDMHLHTTASDGSCTPSEVCQLAIDRNLAAIAITDHDTVDGVADAITYADNWNSTLPPISSPVLPPSNRPDTTETSRCVRDSAPTE